ncbi:AI-2E family transporter [Herbaspirillum robiniae]|uniref:AI-2E family transporter n=1 Tax=Herbaspirillum robiniae TaxID=2014887 RepID=A0A246WVW8_9BURK|nr:AI-2E family transporter [Herbaspirillum robiniae]NUU00811.1 AI-2E family transporter [Herbaspirillum robiniae]OWY31184.1 AI-2E family transporter [Herbaspirillum robiniae]
MLGFDFRVARIAWTVFLVALLLYVTYTVSSTLLVLVFAVFFSYLVYPLVEQIERVRPRRVPRTVSIAVVFVLVIAIVAAVSAVFGARIQDEALHLSEQLPALLRSNDVVSRIPLPGFAEPLRERILGFVRDQLANGTDQAMPLAKQFGVGVMHAASNLIYLVLVPVISFLLIKEAPAMRDEMLSWMNSANRRLWDNIIKDLDVLLSRYVRALLFLSIATLVAYSIAFSLMGVPYSMLLAGLAAVLEFIPFAGPLAASAAALVVAGFSGYDHLLWLIGFIVAYRIFQDYVLNPYLMSEGVEVSPLMVILGLLAGDQLGGVAGIFLSVPAMAALKIIFTRASAAQKARRAAEAREAELAAEALQRENAPPVQQTVVQVNIGEQK